MWLLIVLSIPVANSLLRLLGSTLLALSEVVGLGPQVGGSRPRLVEVSAKSGLKERSEDDLGTTESGKCQPQQEHKLEGEVEGEPVDDVDQALNHGEESENDPVSEPLGIVILLGGEEGIQGVVSGDDEAGEVGQELASEVEDNEEEVESGEPNGGVDLGDRGLLLKVVEGGILRKLTVELVDITLNTILSRHLG